MKGIQNVNRQREAKRSVSQRSYGCASASASASASQRQSVRLARYQRLSDAILQTGLSDWSKTLKDAGLSDLASQVSAMRQPILSAKQRWSTQQTASQSSLSGHGLSDVDIQRLASAVSAMLVSQQSAPVSQPAPVLTPDQIAILASAVMPSQRPDSQPASVLAHASEYNKVSAMPVKDGHGLWSKDKASQSLVWSVSAKSGWHTEYPCHVGHSGVISIHVWQTSNASLSAPVIITSDMVKSQLQTNIVSQTFDVDGMPVYSFQLTPALGLLTGHVRVNVKTTAIIK